MTPAETRYYKSHTMSTYSGRRVDPLKLKRADIDVRDIAHALANLCRFNGHCREFYSVAQHAVLVSRIVEKNTKDPFAAYAALHHDDTEAYLGDVIRPLKMTAPLTEFRLAEARALTAIEKALDFDLDAFSEHVDPVDKAIVFSEARVLFPSDTDVTAFPPDTLGIKITPWAPTRAREEYMVRHDRILRQIR